MTFENPFALEGQWLKGNLHTHTTLSDGELPPQERAAAYEAQGYDFLALTDHDRLADVQGLATDNMLLLAGIEVVGSNPLRGPGYHIVGINLPPEFRLPAAKDAQALIYALKDAGALVNVAHPYWCGLTIKDLEILRDYLAIEVFNTTCEVTIGKGTSSVHWDDLLALRRRVFAVAVDDTHAITRDAYRGWVMAKCKTRSKEGVVEALANGRFYSTCGPIISAMQAEGNRVSVATSPVARINFICSGASGRQVVGQDGRPITSAEHTLGGSELYVRVECTDAAGRTAWTNPVFLR